MGSFLAVEGPIRLDPVAELRRLDGCEDASGQQAEFAFGMKWILAFISGSFGLKPELSAGAAFRIIPTFPAALSCP